MILMRPPEEVYFNRATFIWLEARVQNVVSGLWF
jgi:hypothetical protein